MRTGEEPLAWFAFVVGRAVDPTASETVRGAADARDQPSNGVGQIVVTTGRVVVLVAAGAGGVTLQRDDLLDRACMVDQVDATVLSIGNRWWLYRSDFGFFARV